MATPILRVLFKVQTAALLTGSLLGTAIGCTRTPEVIVLAPSATAAGAIVPTRAPTVVSLATVPPATPAATEPPAPVPPTDTPASGETPAPALFLAGQPITLAAEQAAVDSTQSGEINDASPWQIYPLRGDAGDFVDFKLDTAGGLRPLLLVLDPAGREIARNQSGSDTPQAVIRGVELESSDAHYVVITRVGGSDGFSTGTYNLTLTAGSPDVQSGLFSAPTSYESLDTGSISDAEPQQVFTFDGLAGDVISAQATVLSGDLDPRLVLSDALGMLLAYNDDDPAGGTFDPAIYQYTLPADASYTLNVQRYGDTTGDFRLKLTRDGQAAPGSPVQAPLDLYDSASIRDDGIFVTDFRAGDQITEASQELRVQTLLTFHLPPLPAGSEPGSAQLVLNVCSEGGEGFAGLGPLSVYLDPYGELRAGRDVTRPRTGARLLTTVESCEPVDVSAAIADAYAAGEPVIQFRLAFRAANHNGEVDEIRFDPRLTISAGG